MLQRVCQQAVAKEERVLSHVLVILGVVEARVHLHII